MNFHRSHWPLAFLFFQGACAQSTAPALDVVVASLEASDSLQQNKSSLTDNNSNSLGQGLRTGPIRASVSNALAIQYQTSCSNSPSEDEDCGLKLEFVSSEPSEEAGSAGKWTICGSAEDDPGELDWYCDQEDFVYVNDYQWFDIKITSINEQLFLDASKCEVSAYGESSPEVDFPLDISSCWGSNAYAKAAQAMGDGNMQRCPESPVSAESLKDWHASHSNIDTLLGFCQSSNIECSYGQPDGANDSATRVSLSYAAFNEERFEHLKIECTVGLTTLTASLTMAVAVDPADESQKSGYPTYVVRNDLDQDSFGVPKEEPEITGAFRGAPYVDRLSRVASLFVENTDSENNDYSVDNRDCDDHNPNVHPGATELCNDEIDSNCDGNSYPADDDCDVDQDGDGFTNSENDCNDRNEKIYPNAVELCNGDDDDCDGVVDEDQEQYASFIRDLDEDKYATESPSVLTICDTEVHLDGYTLSTELLEGLDCSDSNPDIYPGKQESCDGLDQDCDDRVDEDLDCSDADVDGDGATQSEDCDDLDPGSYPAANEVCDGRDNDCDGETDEGHDSNGNDEIEDSETFDSDGLGGPDCIDNDGDGWSEDAGDCNDEDPSIVPVWNSETSQFETQFFLDEDGDGFSEPDKDWANDLGSCSFPPGYVLKSSGDDCNDQNESIYPGAVEVCDDVDQDCDSWVDETLPSTWARSDGDADGFGNENELATLRCVGLAGWVSTRGDCDDNNLNVHPGAFEEEDEIDSDCGGTDARDPHVGLGDVSESSITAALASAQEGQTIWVGPGEYLEHDLAFPYLDLSLIATHGRAETTIDAEKEGRVLLFLRPDGMDTPIEGYPNQNLEGFSLINGLSDYGGNIIIQKAGPRIVDCRIAGGESTVDGGAIYAESDTSILDHVEITSNTSNEDGGAFQLDFSLMEIKNSRILDNWCEDEGSAIFTWSGYPKVSNTLIQDNISVGNDNATGTIAVFWSGFAMSNSELIDNFTNNIIAGISFYGQDSIYLDQTLSNVLVKDNVSNGWGAIQANDEAEPIISNVVVMGNSKGNGIDSHGVNAVLTLVNSMSLYNEDYQVYENSDTGGRLEMAYSLLWALEDQQLTNISNEDCIGCVWVEPNFNVNPIGENSNDYDLHIGLSSPAVDSGHPSTFDPDGTRSDIGIYGGPYGDKWDRDFDGVPDYFWPGTIYDAPTGFDFNDYDCDDQDPFIQRCSD